MKLFTTVAAVIVLAQSLIHCVESHTALTQISYGSVAKSDSCHRPGILYDIGPVGYLNSTDIRCAVNSRPAPSTCSIPAGSEVTLYWTNAGHPGPIAVYMAPLKSQGDGNSWFKIWEHNWDTQTSQWGSNDFENAPFAMKVTIPKGLKSGKYILRGEHIGLHISFELDGYQIYAGCFDITVTGGGNQVCKNSIAIPGNQYATRTSPCVYIPNGNNGFNKATYKGCGPAVCSLSGGKSRRRSLTGRK